MFGFLQSKPKTGLPPLQLHNTLSNTLEEFSPLNGEVRMYNCGPTVYDQQHIGNLRPYIFADTIRRALGAWGYKVKQVINITDVGHLTSDADEGEDKMELGARRAGKSAQDIAKEITELWFSDLDAVGIDRKQIFFPRATEYIGEQVALIQALEEKGYAYTIADGVYFNTAKFKGYGKLGQINLAGLEAGARVEENLEKKNPHDFALWKFSKLEEKRQQEWQSPWGVGFPGWHIECTAMIFKLLGKQIDIHTGGIDHIPVHHNNEIAQAEAITGKQYVKYWLHNEFITIEGKKISKSLGNTIYLHNIVDRGINPRALRYWFLTAHYRTQANFTWDALEAADTALTRLNRIYLEAPSGSVDTEFMHTFFEAISDDLNTPKALAHVWQQIKSLNKQTLAAVDGVLGLGLSDAKPTAKLTIIEQKELPEEVQNLLNKREEARNTKNFALADDLRKQIFELGYEVKDTAEGPNVTSRQ